MLTVSVVIPAYNAASFVRESIRSAEAQIYPMREIIVVDDGSTDGTSAEVEGFGSARVRLIRKPNGGSASARNLGIRAATGDLIAFLDADDLWLPDKTGRQVARMQETGASLVYCGKSWVDDQGRPISNRDPQVNYPEGDLFLELIRANYISSASCVLAARQSLEEAGGFNESAEFRNGQDYELWLRMARLHRMAAVPQELVLYRRHGGNVTNNRENYYIAAMRALEVIDGIAERETDPRSPRPVIRRRIRELVTGGILEMFYDGDYATQRRFMWMALSRGWVSWRHLHLLFLGLLPERLIDLLREWKKGIDKVIGA